MRLVAHRGFDKQHSANTVTAVEKAIPHADMVEVDIRRCASGELVAAHDAAVDIGIDGVNQVDELTAPELAELDAHDGEGIQTLDTIFNAIPSGMGVNLELKEPEISEQALAVAESVPHEVIISSFDSEALRGVHPEEHSNVELAYILGATPDDDDLAVATDLGCAFVHPNAWLCLVTGIVGRAHDAGLAVNAWTVDSRPGAWALSRRGVDGLIASSPHVVDWIE